MANGRYTIDENLSWTIRYNQALGYVWGKEDEHRITKGTRPIYDSLSFARWYADNRNGNLFKSWYEWETLDPKPTYSELAKESNSNE